MLVTQCDVCGAESKHGTGNYYTIHTPESKEQKHVCPECLPDDIQDAITDDTDDRRAMANRVAARRG